MKPEYSMVKKSNDMIQRAKFSLSIQETRLLDFLISLVRTQDDAFREYELDLKIFCALFGIDYKNGKNRINLKNALQTLSDKSMWIEIDGEERLVRWITKPKINKKTNKVKVRLDEDLAPYLLHLNKNFYSYQLGFTCRFTSSYSHPLYELIKSVQYNDLEPYDYVIPVGDLKLRMGILEGYEKFFNFRVRALDPAIKEINLYSDKAVQYTPIITGRTITHIRLHIESKGIEERVRLMAEAFHDDSMVKLSELLEGLNNEDIRQHNQANEEDDGFTEL